MDEWVDPRAREEISSQVQLETFVRGSRSEHHIFFFFSFALRLTILFSGSNEKYEPFRNRIIPAPATHMTVCKRENLAKTTSCQWCVMLVMIRSFFACYTLFGDVITLSIRCQDGGWTSGPRHETHLFVRSFVCLFAGLPVVMNQIID